MKYIQSTLLLGLTILFIFAIGTTNIFNFQIDIKNKNGHMVYAQQMMMGSPGGGGGQFGMESQQPQEPGEYISGSIASIQNGKNNKPEWLLSGAWNSAVVDLDKEKHNLNQIPPNVITGDDNKLIAAMFQASFDMILLNGSSLHTHNINNFTLSQIPNNNENNNYVINGTATISMKDGPVNDVPISINVLDNNVISIWTDPSKINNHFGNTPIYGQILQDIVIKK